MDRKVKEEPLPQEEEEEPTASSGQRHAQCCQRSVKEEPLQQEEEPTTSSGQRRAQSSQRSVKEEPLQQEEEPTTSSSQRRAQRSQHPVSEELLQQEEEPTTSSGQWRAQPCLHLVKEEPLQQEEEPISGQWRAYQVINMDHNYCANFADGQAAAVAAAVAVAVASRNSPMQTVKDEDTSSASDSSTQSHLSDSSTPTKRSVKEETNPVPEKRPRLEEPLDLTTRSQDSGQGASGLNIDLEFLAIPGPSGLQASRQGVQTTDGAVPSTTLPATNITCLSLDDRNRAFNYKIIPPCEKSNHVTLTIIRCGEEEQEEEIRERIPEWLLRFLHHLRMEESPGPWTASGEGIYATKANDVMLAVDFRLCEGAYSVFVVRTQTDGNDRIRVRFEPLEESGHESVSESDPECGPDADPKCGGKPDLDFNRDLQCHHEPHPESGFVSESETDSEITEEDTDEDLSSNGAKEKRFPGAVGDPDRKK